MTEALASLTSALAERYRVERELGQGGMATVYLAHDLRHDRDVAIKVVHPDLGAALGGSIAFETGNRLYLIPPAGGSPHLLRGTHFANSLRITPDGRGVLYVDDQGVSKLMYYDLASDSAFTVMEEAGEGQYVPTGHIVYRHPNGGRFAVRLDVRRHTVIGTPIPIVPDIRSGLVAPFVITRNGTLVYRAGLDPEYRFLISSIGPHDVVPGGRE